MNSGDSRALDAQSWAAKLLCDLGANEAVPPAGPFVHPALRWAECGAMALTGHRDGPPLMCPVPLASCADGAVLALRAVAGAADGVLPRGGELLAERAALGGLRRNGRIAPGGACRLLECGDGRIALSLARAHDWAMLPAFLGEKWLGSDLGATDGAWRAVATAASGVPVEELVERGRLLSLAIAADRLPATPTRGWFVIDCEQPAARRSRGAGPLVVDLSALWAGPLCTRLLGLLGARVVKVESTKRPDGARSGSAEFFDLLNRGKSSLTLDLDTTSGRDQLRRLLVQADIVVEASRPRALEQLGIDAAEFCAAGRALTWISLTGYGRAAPEGDWIAFGDDAGVAAGLATVMQHAVGEPVFCGDAIADPMAGMHAALAAWWSYLGGGARRIALSLAGVVGHCVEWSGSLEPVALRERQARWKAVLRDAGGPVRPPVVRARPSVAHASGTGGFVYDPGESRPA
jgi:crotonobetainyl-CoA:carnitine CoA-transferase CaiB-like acyl-CoA transferase